MIGVLNVVMTIVAIRIIDRVGRKPMLLAGLRRHGGEPAVLGSRCRCSPAPHRPVIRRRSSRSSAWPRFIVSFAATWGPVVWVMFPEVLPLSVRGTAMGVAVCLQLGRELRRLADLPDHARQLGPGPVFLGYAGMGVLALLFVKALVTETKGRSLEEIEADLQRKTGAGEPAVAGAGGSGRFERGASANERTPADTHTHTTR